MEDLAGAKELIGVTKEFLSPVGETLNDAWQLVIGDRLSHWRLRNAMKLQQATNAEATKIGLALNSERIPERYAYAWFKKATEQDEPELQTLFARLLVKAASGDTDALDRRLIGLLSEMTPIDALVFQRLYSDRPFPNSGAYADATSIADQDGPYGPNWPRRWMMSLLKDYHPENAEVCVEHLITIGCLQPVHKAGGSNFRPRFPKDDQNKERNWQRYIQDSVSLDTFVASTGMGRALARALKY